MAVRTNGNSIRIFTGVADHSGPYTVTFWTKYYTLADGGLISLNQGVSTSTEDAITALAGGNTQLMAVGGSGGTANVNADPVTEDETWYHWALVRENATTLKMYVNGVVRATTTSDVSGRAASDHFAFARRGDFGGSDIECAALKVWNGRALNAEEIAEELPYRNPQNYADDCVLTLPFVDAGTWLTPGVKEFANSIFDDGVTSVSTVSDPVELLGNDPETVVVLQVATQAASSTSNTVSFSAVSPGDLLVFVVSHSNGGVTITPPAGLTAFTNRGTQWPKLATYARVVESGDSTSWNFTFDNSDPSYIHAYRIQGPFTDLAGVTITDDDSFGASSSRRILLADTSIDADTLCIAAVTKYNTGAASFSNAFENVQNTSSEGISSLATARRMYSSTATGVYTTASWSGSNTGNSALIRIAAPVSTSGVTIQRHGATSSSTLEVEHTMSVQVDSGNNLGLLIAIDSSFVNNVAPVSVIHNGDALSYIDGDGLSWWYIADPDIGIHNVEITFPVDPTGIRFMYWVLEDVDQSASPVYLAGTNGSPIQWDWTGRSAGDFVAVAASRQGSLTTWSLTGVTEDSEGSYDFNGVSDRVAVAGSVVTQDADFSITAAFSGGDTGTNMHGSVAWLYDPTITFSGTSFLGINTGFIF